MNPYLPDIIKKELCLNAATYSINCHSHEETLSVSYININAQKKDTIHFIKKAAIHTSIMEILDYDMPEKESALVAFEKLKSTLPILGIGCPLTEMNLPDTALNAQKKILNPMSNKSCRYYKYALKRIRHYLIFILYTMQ